MRGLPWGTLAYAWTESYTSSHIGLICILCLLAVNLTSLFLLIILNQKQSGYNFFLVHIVILIYLDIVWIAGGCINPGIVLRQDEDD